MLGGSGGMPPPPPQKIFCKMDALRRVFLHSGVILDTYIAERKILVSLFYCTTVQQHKRSHRVNPCPLNLELQRSFSYCYILLHHHSCVSCAVGLGNVALPQLQTTVLSRVLPCRQCYSILVDLARAPWPQDITVCI